MADKKELDQIRPARGVKLKSKAPRPEKPKPERPRRISDVQPDVSAEQREPPTEDAIKFISQLNNAKQELVGTMKEFSKLLRIKTLSSNSSSKEKEHENRVIDELIRAAITVDRINAGQNEGVLSLSVFAARLSLLLRNAGNELAYEVKKLSDRVAVLEGESPVVEEKDVDDQVELHKQYLLEEAKKLGIKISVED